MYTREYLQACARALRAEWRDKFDWQEDEYCLPPQMVIDYNATECGGVLEDEDALDAVLSAPVQIFDGRLMYSGEFHNAAMLYETMRRARPFSVGNEETAWWARVMRLASLGAVAMPEWVW